MSTLFACCLCGHTNSEYSPICTAEHLAPFLPGHPLLATGGSHGITAVSAAPFGSASICLISWAYIKMLGGQGLTDSSKIALLNANYMAHRLSSHYSLRFKNGNGRVAHELLIDLAEFDKAAGLKVTDFAKRLQVSLRHLEIALRLIPHRITDSTHQLVLGPSRPACSLNQQSQRHWKK